MTNDTNRGGLTAAPSARPLPDALPRDGYGPLSLYAPVRPAVDHDLSDNTNQWGAPPSVAAALGGVNPVVLTQYPAQPTTALLEAIARYNGVTDARAVMASCGSDDLLDCMMRGLARPGDRIALSWPSFSMVPYFARTNGLEPVLLPFTHDWDANADALLAANARITYLCAPNNPTGTPLTERTVQRVLDEANGVVVIDEAYAEFSSRTWAKEAETHGRLVVTRTMSKAFGLAGMRVGYAIGHPALLHEIEIARGPYKIGALSDLAATTALTHDAAWMRDRAADAIAARTWLTSALLNMGLAPLPSEANFVLVPVPDASAVAARMAEGGILVRAFTALPGVGDALRITVGPPGVMTRCIALLSESLAVHA